MNARNEKTAAKPARVELQFLEAVRRRRPEHRLLLEALGDLYTRTGRYEDGLKVELELTSLRPDDPGPWYNLACDYALMGRRDDALQALTKAVRQGYRDFDWMLADEDLQSLRQDPAFRRLIEQARKKGSPS